MRVFALFLSTALLLNSVQGEDVVLFRESFDDPDLAKRGWYDITAIRLAAEAQAGKSCIEYEWTGPDEKVSGSSAMRRGFEPTDELFIRYYLKLSKGWDWSGRNYHPHLTHFMTTENGKWHGPAASHLTLYVEPVNGRLRLATQDIQNKDAPHGLTQGPLKGGYNGKFYDSVETLFKDDQWHCVEAQFKLNTLDLQADKANADGIVRGWFDGQLVIDHTDVILRSTDFPNMKFNQFLMAPYFGPGLLPHAQKLWIDELVVGTKRSLSGRRCDCILPAHDSACPPVHHSPRFRDRRECSRAQSAGAAHRHAARSSAALAHVSARVRSVGEMSAADSGH
ncbi:MAG TPA: hypothetical protein VFD27_11285 [Chthoniobacteraceae bacterium]|nr:hypothetical protein [Chthoniobacteraceae bacterium]